MKRTTPLLVLVLLAAPAAAQTTQDARPGLITADSPLYGLDLALDNALKPPGERAHERASEALVAAEANDTQALDRAVTALNQTVAQVNGISDADGLANVEQILQEVKERVPEEAQPGIDTALDNVLIAQQRDQPLRDRGRP